MNWLVALELDEADQDVVSDAFLVAVTNCLTVQLNGGTDILAHGLRAHSL